MYRELTSNWRPKAVATKPSLNETKCSHTTANTMADNNHNIHQASFCLQDSQQQSMQAAGVGVTLVSHGRQKQQCPHR